MLASEKEKPKLLSNSRLKKSQFDHKETGLSSIKYKACRDKVFY